MTDEKILEKKENMTVKLDSAVGFKSNQTDGETLYKNHMKAITHNSSEALSNGKFDAHKIEIDKKMKESANLITQNNTQVKTPQTNQSVNISNNPNSTVINQNVKPAID